MSKTVSQNTKTLIQRVIQLMDSKGVRDILLAKDDKDFNIIISDAISNLKKDGTLARLAEKTRKKEKVIVDILFSSFKEMHSLMQKL